MSTGAALPGYAVPSGAEVSPGGPQGVGGPANIGFIAKTAAYTVQYPTDKGLYFLCTGGNWTLTLPAAANGFYFWVRNDMGITGTTGTITLSPPSGTIDGAASLALLPGQQCMVACDGTNWRTFGLQREVVIGSLQLSGASTYTVLLPLGYRLFEIGFLELVTAAVDAPYTQWSVNGGTSFWTANYYGQIIYNATASSVASYDGENVGSVQIAPATPAPGVYWGAGSRYVFDPGSATLGPSVLITAAGNRSLSSSANMIYAGGWFFQNTPGPVNAIRIFANGGNTMTGSVTVKGIV